MTAEQRAALAEEAERWRPFGNRMSSDDVLALLADLAAAEARAEARAEGWRACEENARAIAVNAHAQGVRATWREAAALVREMADPRGQTTRPRGLRDAANLLDAQVDPGPGVESTRMEPPGRGAAHQTIQKITPPGVEG